MKIETYSAVNAFLLYLSALLSFWCSWDVKPWRILMLLLLRPLRIWFNSWLHFELEATVGGRGYTVNFFSYPLGNIFSRHSFNLSGQNIGLLLEIGGWSRLIIYIEWGIWNMYNHFCKLPGRNWLIAQNLPSYYSAPFKGGSLVLVRDSWPKELNLSSSSLDQTWCTYWIPPILQVL